MFVYGSQAASNPLALAFETIGTMPALIACAIFAALLITACTMLAASLAPAAPVSSHKARLQAHKARAKARAKARR